MLLFALLLNTPLDAKIEQVKTPIQIKFMPLKGEGDIYTNCIMKRDFCLQLKKQENDNAPNLLIKNGKNYDPIDGLSLAPIDDYTKFFFDDKIIDLGNSKFLISIIEHNSTMYSGGGASVDTLHLFELSKVGTNWKLSKELLNIPYRGSKMIRACFSEQDMKNRHGACHDEYDYVAAITIAKGSNNGFPNLTYKAVSTDYPAGVSLDKDNTGKIKKSDLYRQKNMGCTFTRMITFDKISKQYKLNKPIPNCDDYLAL